VSVPDVTVSIVNTSNKDEVLGCLDSLTRGGFKHDVEVVVLDNSSDDGSVEAIRAAHPDVRVIAQPHRAGFAANHNVVYGQTDSRYIWVLNDDTVVDPGVLDALVDYLDANPGVGTVSPAIVGTGGHRQQTAWRARTPLRALLFAVSLAQVGFVQSQGDRARDVEVLGAAALLIRRSALGGSLPFDERFYMYCEDEDLSRRLRAAGHRLVYMPEIAVTHEGSHFSAHIPDNRINEIWRSLRLLSIKHHGRVRGRVVLLGIGTGRALIGAVMWAVMHLPDRLRPARSELWYPRGNFLQAANAWRGVRGPGLRELAEQWNAERAP
jgi:GT2 family glycosyltransferase